MTKSGVKTEDYREITDYWIKRLTVGINDIDYGTSQRICHEIYLNWKNSGGRFVFKDFATNIMTLGYPAKTDTDRILKLEHKGIEIRTGNPEWGAEPNKLYFVILHGNIIQ